MDELTTELKIAVPDTVPTRGTDTMIANESTLEQMTDFARGRESAYERLKLIHDNMLQDGFAPYLPLVKGISDEELAFMIQEAGWVFAAEQFREQFGTAEEWQMWTGRFRRFLAVAKASGKL